MATHLMGLAYISRISPAIRRDVLKRVVCDILESSQRNNPQWRVTGVLLVGDTHFAQMLEGPAESVTSVMHVVAGDPRHCDVQELFTERLSGRRFGKWAMAYGAPHAAQPADRVIGVVDSADRIGFGLRGQDLAQDLVELLACAEADAAD